MQFASASTTVYNKGVILINLLHYCIYDATHGPLFMYMQRSLNELGTPIN